MARKARMPNRLIEPETRRRRVPGEVFGYPGTRNYLAREPERADFPPGDPATLERLRTAKSRTGRLRATPGTGKKRRS